MTYLDEELIEDFRKINTPIVIFPKERHNSIVQKINDNIPFSGSQIAWSLLKKSTYLGATTSQASLKSLNKKIKLIAEGDVFFVGDSTDNAYSIDVKDLSLALRIFSTIPQHTYITQEDQSWIACISFEGDIYFAIL